MDGRVTLARSGRRADIVIDRPAAKNATTLTMLDEFTAIVADLTHDDTTDVVVISGAGTDFCAGADVGDITELLTLDAARRAATFEVGMREQIQPLIRGLLDLEQAVVVSARGYAIGLGAALLLASDLVVLADSARISVPQVTLGHTLDHGESWLLPRKIGLGRAMQLALLGELLHAVDAKRFGAANLVVAEDELAERTDELVRSLLASSSAALRGTKRLLANSLEREAQFAAEIRTAAGCAATQDFVDAIEAQLGSGRRRR